jgi:proton-dependent oligopeptide transporter, POT family
VSITATPRPEPAAAPDRPAILDDTALFGQPRGLLLVSVVEMWERFSFYGMRAILVLFLTNALGWTGGNASRLYGMYAGLVWLTPLFGGYLADRILGTRRSLVIGALVIAAGHFLLALQSMATFYAGLAFVVVGTGFFKPNVSTMVGQIYRPGDPRRDSGFTIYYMGINVGAFLAPLVCGWLGERVGWHYGFGAAGVGMLIGLAIYLWGRDRYLPGIGLPPHARPEVVETVRKAAFDAPSLTVAAESPAKPAIGGAVVGALLAWVMGGMRPDVVAWIASGGWMALLTGVCIGAALAVTVLGTHGEERHRVIALFIVAFFVIFFWMAFEQAASTMNLFADRYTRLPRLGSEPMPASWFQSVNSAFVILLAPVFAALWVVLGRRNREPPTALKMVLGLTFLGLGFVFLVVGGRQVDACIAVNGPQACHVASPWWLVFTYLFHTLGELCLSPVGLSYVTKVAPVKFASLLMGVWFLAQAAANFLGGYIAGLTDQIGSQAAFFSIFLATSVGAALLMLALVPVLKRLTRSVHA